MKEVGGVKKYLSIALICLVALLVLIYGGYQAKNLIEGPVISISSPKNGSTLSSPLVLIEGKALRIAFITLNDRQIFVNEQGDLREQLLLQSGYNIISIKATDRFNRRAEVRLELMYKKPN
jgi:hypothetical protein